MRPKTAVKALSGSQIPLSGRTRASRCCRIWRRDSRQSQVSWQQDFWPYVRAARGFMLRAHFRRRQGRGL